MAFIVEISTHEPLDHFNVEFRKSTIYEGLNKSLAEKT